MAEFHLRDPCLGEGLIKEPSWLWIGTAARPIDMCTEVAKRHRIEARALGSLTACSYDCHET